MKIRTILVQIYPKGYTLAVPNVQLMERCYYRARKVAEKRGVKIYSATKGGKLGVFKRIDYDSLF